MTATPMMAGMNRLSATRCVIKPGVEMNMMSRTSDASSTGGARYAAPAAKYRSCVFIPDPKSYQGPPEGGRYAMMLDGCRRLIGFGSE